MIRVLDERIELCHLYGKRDILAQLWKVRISPQLRDFGRQTEGKSDKTLSVEIHLEENRRPLPEHQRV